MKHSAVAAIAAASALFPTANAYWLMGAKNFITTERIDPVVNPGEVSGHTHSVVGGSNFGFNVTTEKLLKSECTSVPIVEDNSNYWFPHLYFQWSNGSFSSVDGGAVIYYLFDDKPGTTKAFPPNFRMLSGNPASRTYDQKSFEQQAVTFLCLDFQNAIGGTTKHNSIPKQQCPDGIRAQINFQSCWDGKNLDSSDHKSHVAYRSEGPDAGSCKDPKFPVTLPRIFLEVYWGTHAFRGLESEAKDPKQPFVFANGDPTGYGYHADFFNGWQPGVLQRAVDECHCNPYGDPTCCAEKGIFTLEKEKKCFITKSVDEQTTGMLLELPGNNPVQPEGVKAAMLKPTSTPGILSPVYVYRDEGKPSAPGKLITSPSDAGATKPTLPPVQVGIVVSTSSALASTSSSSSAASTTSSSSAPASNATGRAKSCSKANSTLSRRRHHARRGIHHGFDSNAF
ncbi:hypothetical protein CPC08DRAFT_538623 [Agrocybe pediades]|nr:hypothetical protein CPC08DRAFT_538623 [Agrocybe pediades]